MSLGDSVILETTQNGFMNKANVSLGNIISSCVQSVDRNLVMWHLSSTGTLTLAMGERVNDRSDIKDQVNWQLIDGTRERNVKTKQNKYREQTKNINVRIKAKRDERQEQEKASPGHLCGKSTPGKSGKIQTEGILCPHSRETERTHLGLGPRAHGATEGDDPWKGLTAQRHQA